MKYAWIERNRRHWPVSLACEVLRVSPSGYHERKRREKAHGEGRRRSIGNDVNRPPKNGRHEVCYVDLVEDV